MTNGLSPPEAAAVFLEMLMLPDTQARKQLQQMSRQDIEDTYMSARGMMKAANSIIAQAEGVTVEQFLAQLGRTIASAR